MRINRKVDNAQIESEEVDAVSVRKIGDRARSERKTRIDDFRVFAPIFELRKGRTESRKKPTSILRTCIETEKPLLKNLPSNITKHEHRN